ncbi:hypothetical protein LZ31DRAFT_607945 [Colletotrichum somersetense]|nr:hypothetical protein LZ31DRAFT_607945 [Colletotrichum somersetense]
MAPILPLVVVGLSIYGTYKAVHRKKYSADVAVNNHWVDHDKVEPFPQYLHSGLDGELEDRFSPLIGFKSGCVSYAAVDSQGAAGAGLYPSGKAGGDCRDSKQSGQTYARVGESKGRWAIMYSYYLPKVQTKKEKHRHGFVTVVVWLRAKSCTNKASNFSPAGVSYLVEAKGEDKSDSTKLNALYSARPGSNGDATHVVVTYDGGSQLVPAEDGGAGSESPPIIDWSRIPDKAKDQLNGIQYAYTEVPFSDDNFQKYLDAAYDDGYYMNVPEDGYDCNDGSDVLDQ